MNRSVYFFMNFFCCPVSKSVTLQKRLICGKVPTDDIPIIFQEMTNIVITNLKTHMATISDQKCNIIN